MAASACPTPDSQSVARAVLLAQYRVTSHAEKAGVMSVAARRWPMKAGIPLGTSGAWLATNAWRQIGSVLGSFDKKSPICGLIRTGRMSVMQLVVAISW